MKFSARVTLLSFGGFFLILIVGFIIMAYNLGMYKFFAPKMENARREVFENTKSYNHGKIQELAKYYEEYQKAETLDDKQAIENLIKFKFSGFDANNINVQQLKQFLISIRGY